MAISGTTPKAQNPTITGPLVLTLHPDGVDFFIKQKKPLSRRKLVDGTEEYGLTMPAIDAKLLQRLAYSGYIHRLEQVIGDIPQQRSQTVDVTKLFAYTMLYRQFDSRMWDLLLTSELSLLWNRRYPKYAITADSAYTDPAYRRIIDHYRSDLDRFKQHSMAILRAHIESNTKLEGEERKKLLFLAIRFIKMVDPLLLILITVFSDAKPTAGVLNQINALLMGYIERVDIAEFLGLLVIEMLIQAGDMRVLPDGKPQHQPVFLSYELSAKRREPGERGRLRLLLGNQHGDYESLLQRIKQTTEIDVAGLHLEDAALQDVMGEDRGLGMYYLAYVRDACRQFNIDFDSTVGRTTRPARTLIDLRFLF